MEPLIMATSLGSLSCQVGGPIMIQLVIFSLYLNLPYSSFPKCGINSPPTHSGFARSFGIRLANGERREWIKPIMFSGGLGSIEDAHVKKEAAETGDC